MATPRPPKAPPATGESGRRLWDQVVDRYDLDEHERALLLEAVRTVDTLDRLAAVVEKDGPMTTNGRGEVVAHPAVIEARQQRLVLARLVASLRLPEESDDTTPVRSVAGLHGAPTASGGWHEAACPGCAAGSVDRGAQ